MGKLPLIRVGFGDSLFWLAKWIGKLHRRHKLETNSFINLCSRHGTSSSSQYPLYQKQQQYYHQQISKSKRSKSMDDFGTQMVFEQSSRIQRNNVRNGGNYNHQSPTSQMGKRSPQGNGVARATNHHPPQPQHKNQMRYSVDNLLEIDTSYYNNYQVSEFVEQANNLDQKLLQKQTRNTQNSLQSLPKIYSTSFPLKTNRNFHKTRKTHIKTRLCIIHFN